MTNGTLDLRMPSRGQRRPPGQPPTEPPGWIARSSTCFAERPLAGNQLAVIRRCAHLDTSGDAGDRAGMNFSETSFVVEERPGEASVRIFTVDRELPFAGHPYPSAPPGCWDRAAMPTRWTSPPGRFGSPSSPAASPGWSRRRWRSATRWTRSGPRRWPGWMPPSWTDRYPCRFATIGPWFLLVGVRTLDALRRGGDRSGRLPGPRGGRLAVALRLRRGALQPGRRFLRPYADLPRDAARGPGDGKLANAALAAHLHALGRPRAGHRRARASRSAARRGSISTSPTRSASAARCNPY